MENLSSMHKNYFWIGLDYFYNKEKKYLKKVKEYQDRLKNPVNKKTGKPLDPRTIKKYKSECERLKKTIPQLKDALDKINKIGYGCRYPYIIESDFNFDKYEDLLKEFPKVKKAIEIKMKNEGLPSFDLVQMTQFILYHQDAKREYKNVGINLLCSGIAVEFINLIDSMIAEKGEQSSSNLD